MDNTLESVEPNLSDSTYESIWRDLWVMEDDVAFSQFLLEEASACWPDVAIAQDFYDGADSVKAPITRIDSCPVHNPMLDSLIFLLPLVNDHSLAGAFHERLIVS
ncbi:unnamed protein product [Calypogeia fissa]